MAFVKRPKLCMDGPAGIQQVNGIVDNLDSLKDELELEHAPLEIETGESDVIYGANEALNAGTLSTALSPPPGAHDSPLVARGVAMVRVYQFVSGPLTSLFVTHGCLRSFDQIDTGQFFFPVAGFSSVWGRVTPYGEAETPAVDARVNAYVGDEGLGTGLLVKTFKEQSSGAGTALLPFDVGFHLVCFGRR